MKYDPHKHHRRSIRLKGYDYSQSGAYFVTICAHRGQSMLGEIQDGVMVLNPLGAVVEHAWHDLPNHYPHIELDAFVIMPNHVHGIIVLVDTDPMVGAGDVGADNVGAGDVGADNVGAGFKPAPTGRHGLSEIIRAFKTFSARRINQLRDATGNPCWQRNYYEHIIRHERALDAIRQYIVGNPANWRADQLHPDAPRNQFNTAWYG